MKKQIAFATGYFRITDPAMNEKPRGNSLKQFCEDVNDIVSGIWQFGMPIVERHYRS